MPKYVVAVGTLGGATVDGRPGTLMMQGELAEAAMFPDGEWKRLVESGTVREATDLEAVLGDARAWIRRAREATPGTLEAEALSAAAAIAERIIAEPTDKPAQKPKEVAELVREQQRTTGLRPATAAAAPAPAEAASVEPIRRDTEPMRRDAERRR